MDIAISSLFTMIILVAQHYAPWRMWLGRDLPRLAAYVMGVLAIVLPLEALFLLTGEYRPAIALITAVFAGGAAVFGCYGLDACVKNLRDARDARAREALVRGHVEINRSERGTQQHATKSPEQRTGNGA